ncbi:hypothetical protein N0V90_005835 [Kalmusia sp. IMI 367209]|nr:hypothetical protein N0V90_005835 [Kalmusia sp. IMI 367209]
MALEDLAIQFLKANRQQFCVCHAALVFDTLKVDFSRLVQSASVDDQSNFAEVHLLVSWASQTPSDHVSVERNSVEDDTASTPFMDQEVLLNLECRHIFATEVPSKSGHVWEDSITKTTTTFNQDEEIYFSWDDSGSCCLSFSLRAFARLVELLGDVEPRLQQSVISDQWIQKKFYGDPKWTLLPSLDLPIS